MYILYGYGYIYFQWRFSPFVVLCHENCTTEISELYTIGAKFMLTLISLYKSRSSAIGCFNKCQLRLMDQALLQFSDEFVSMRSLQSPPQQWIHGKVRRLYIFPATIKSKTQIFASTRNRSYRNTSIVKILYLYQNRCSGIDVAAADAENILWSKWGEWTDCSQTCGPDGIQTRIRRCAGGARLQQDHCDLTDKEFRGCRSEQNCAKSILDMYGKKSR